MAKCITGNMECIYHACMGDDCQKAQVLKSGLDWGAGVCNVTDTDATDPAGVYDTCPRCGEWFDDADYDFHICHVCGRGE